MLKNKIGCDKSDALLTEHFVSHSGNLLQDSAFASSHFQFAQPPPSSGKKDAGWAFPLRTCQEI